MKDGQNQVIVSPNHLRNMSGDMGGSRQVALGNSND